MWNKIPATIIGNNNIMQDGTYGTLAMLETSFPLWQESGGQDKWWGGHRYDFHDYSEKNCCFLLFGEGENRAELRRIEGHCYDLRWHYEKVAVFGGLAVLGFSLFYKLFRIHYFARGAPNAAKVWCMVWIPRLLGGRGPVVFFWLWAGLGRTKPRT